MAAKSASHLHKEIIFNVAAGYDTRITYAQQKDPIQYESLKTRLDNAPEEVKDIYNKIQRAKTDPAYTEELVRSFKNVTKEVALKNRNKGRSSTRVTAQQVIESRSDDDLVIKMMIVNNLFLTQGISELPQEVQKEFAGFGGGSGGGAGAGTDDWLRNVDTMVQDTIRHEPEYRQSEYQSHSQHSNHDYHQSNDYHHQQSNDPQPDMTSYSSSSDNSYSPD